MKKAIFSILAGSMLFGLSAQSLNDSLKAHFPFNHNLKDISKYGNLLNVNGGISPYVFVSGADSALSFNGTDRLTSNKRFDASTFTQMAISIWIKTSHNSTADQLILQGAGIGFGFGLQAGTEKLYAFFDGSSPGSYYGKNALNDGVWHNIVMQSTGSTTSVYVDGILDGSIAEPLYNPTGGSDNLIYVGASTFNTKSYTGFINDLRIYNRILSPTEISAMFQSSLSVPNLIVEKPLEFSIFPNPSSTGSFSLQLSDAKPGSTISVVDLTGRVIWQGATCSQNSCDVDCQLKPGVYMISIETKGGNTTSKKLIVQ
tara:strand:- start:28 stop:972 length:945 start_codon:yes stop_codon:yes gene_type:complete